MTQDTEIQSTSESGWKWAQPWLVGGMVLCLTSSIARFVHLLQPTWDGLYFMLIPLLAAFAGYYTYRLGRGTYISGDERLRQQLLELALLYVVVKVASYFDESWPAIVANISNWPNHLELLFDPESLAAYGLALMGWFSAVATARDLDNLADPDYRPDAPTLTPTRRLTGRFFFGGCVLMLVAGLTRIQLLDLFHRQRASLGGVILTVLIYFMLGLILLGQMHFTRLTLVWRQQSTTVAADLPRRWLALSAALVGAVLLVAFVLPTGYTLGLLDLAAYLIRLLGFVMTAFLFLLSLPFLWITSLLNQGAEQPLPTLPQTLPELPTATAGSGGTTLAWWQVLRSVFFWGFALVGLYFLMRGYLRDRPELLARLRGLRLVALLRRVWRWIAGAWTALSAAVRNQAPYLLAWLRQRAPVAAVTALLGRTFGDTPRERVFHLYQTTLECAAAQGAPRQATQTPYEYRDTLTPRLPEGRSEIAALTEAFTEARYSAHPVTEEKALALHGVGERLQTFLKALAQESATQPSATTAGEFTHDAQN